MANVQQFLERVTKQALEARENGDTATLNRMTATSPALGNYLNNVVFRGTMTPSQFEYWQRDEYRSIAALAEEYEKREAQAQRVDNVEAKLDKLTAMVEKLVSVQTSKQQAALAEALNEDDVEEEDIDDDADETDDDEDESEPDESDEEADAPRADEAQEADAEAEDD